MTRQALPFIAHELKNGELRRIPSSHFTLGLCEFLLAEKVGPVVIREIFDHGAGQYLWVSSLMPLPDKMKAILRAAAQTVGFRIGFARAKP